MAGRLVVATLLLGSTLLLRIDEKVGYGSFTPRYISWLIVATYALSVLYGAWLLRARRMHAPAAMQLAADLLLVTGLVFISGGAGSGFTFLYGVVVLMAALVVGPTASNAVAVTSLLLYTTLGISLANGWLAHPPDQPPAHYLLPAPDLGFALLSNIVGLVVVAFLATNLAARLRRAGGQLQQAEANAASLAQLNDDIVRSIASGLVTTDLDGRIRTVNSAALQMFATDTATLLGRPACELLPLADAGGDAAGGERGEGTAKRPDGSCFPVGFTATPLLEPDGRVIGTLIAFQDLTEVRALRDAAERAERLATLGRLATGLAHEIRNPLSSISGSVQLVRESEDLGEEDRRLLGIVLSEAERLDDLVTTMLHVGRPSEPSPSETDLDALAADVSEMARRGPAPAAEVRVEHDRSGAVVGRVDAGQMRQVLWNLLKNAIQASPRGGTVRVRVRRDAEDRAVLEVHDEGAGVTETDRDRLFDMFYSGRQHGVGLGLALVKQIVERHGGEVTIADGDGGGSIFRVTLPTSAPRASARNGQRSLSPGT